MRIFRAALCVGVLLPSTCVLAGEPAPAVTIRLDRPDQQAGEIIGLFRGAKAPHPAAVLAAWKRASREPGRLGKPIEAMIAAINPMMAGELRTLDRAEVALRFAPAGGRLGWDAVLPNDDGTFASLATSLVLSGGATDGPMGGLVVDRLGPPGSPLMARADRGVLLALDREGLASALVRLNGSKPDGSLPGLQFSVVGEGLAASRSLALRRLSEALRALRNPILLGQVRLDDSTLGFRARGVFGPKPDAPVAVEPGWLDLVPADRAVAAFAVAVDPTAENWEAAFRLVDRVERVDPARSNMAPVRLRLDLLARGAGVRIESDVLPHLKGLSGWIGSDGREIDRALIAFHLGQDGAAERLCARVKPLQGPARDPVGPDGARFLGSLDGRPLHLFRSGSTVLVAWGEGSLGASLACLEKPAKSAGPSLRKDWFGRKPLCAGGFWPGRVPGIAPEGSPLSGALAGSLPITWEAGWDDGSADFAVELSCTDLRPIVRRFLERIPLDPPPDR